MATSRIQHERRSLKDRDEYLVSAERNYLVAIRAGFEDAMFELGRLYVMGTYGSDKTVNGLPLISRSAELDNPEALLWLGWRHVLGDFCGPRSRAR